MRPQLQYASLGSSGQVVPVLSCLFSWEAARSIVLTLLFADLLWKTENGNDLTESPSILPSTPPSLHPMRFGLRAV